MNTSIVYLIHFERPISPKHTCQQEILNSSILNAQEFSIEE